ASTSSPSTFTTLFLVNAATFAAYGLFVARVRVPPAAAQERTRGYGHVIRDRIALRVLLIDLAVVAAAVSLLNGVFPVYLRDDVGVRETRIGLLFLVNSLLIVGVQLPTARAVEGRRRARALALMACLFAVCWLLTLAAGLAPDGLVGRYLAAAGFSWQLGFIVGPAAGAALVGIDSRVAWAVAAGVCVAAALGALRLDARLPDAARVTARQ